MLDVDASYFYDFANLIPFYQDIPYVAIKGDDMHPDLSYNWYSIVKTTTVGEYPFMSSPPDFIGFYR